MSPRHARTDVDGTALYVRPVGYVEPDPVIRCVGDRDLYIGNRHAADPDRHDRRFDAVVSVSSDAYPLTTDHRPLVDGEAATWSAFADAADAARRRYRQDGSLLVHCKAGISRSTAVIGATLAAEEDRSFHDALTEVQDARPHAVPNPRLHELGVLYVAAEREIDSV